VADKVDHAVCTVVDPAAVQDVLDQQGTSTPSGGCPPRLPQNRACASRTRLFGTGGCEPHRRPVSDLDLSHNASCGESGGTTGGWLRRGHAPTMTLSTYAHLFDELADGDHRPAADQIREAREDQKCPKVSLLCPPEAADPSPDAEALISGAFSEPTPGIEPGTPSLRETPGLIAGEHPGPSETTDPLQMQLFGPDPEDRS